MAPALLISLYCKEFAGAGAFLITIVLMGTIGIPLALRKPSRRNFYAREGFVTVGLTWIIVSLFGAMPGFLSGAIPSFMDAFFESVSGFTTTGASILPNVEVLPKGILYWRSFTHWLGGMGVLVFILAMGPLSKDSGDSMHLLRAESPGPKVGKLVPRIQSSAKILYGIYVFLTAVQILFMLIGGTPLFDAVTISFGTAGTGGFAVRMDGLASYSHFSQNVTTVFMVLCGINFNVYYLLIMREAKRAFKSEELWTYLAVILVSIIAVALNTFHMFGSLGETIHHSAFQVATIISTTGFSTVDFNLWPELSKTLLLLLMAIGACAGSTGGGIKVSRIIIIFKYARRSIIRALRPNSVRLMHIDGELIEDDTVTMVTGYMMLYIVLLALSILLISLDGFDLETNFTAVLSCLNNVGPGLGLVGPAGNFSHYSAFSKLLLSFNMLAGRLEIFPIMALFTPSVWRK